MIINPYLFSHSGVFGVVGDSNADGRGVAGLRLNTGPATLYKWESGSFVDKNTVTVANGGDYASAWQQFAISWKARTNKPVYLVNGASGGAEFYPNGDDNNWYTSGDLYSAFVTDMNAALVARGAANPTAIFINLGINDLRGGTTQTNIMLGVNSLVSRLHSDYPGVPLLLVQIGRSESVANNAAFFALRAALRSLEDSDPLVNIVCSAATWISWGTGYNGDNLHYDDGHLNYIGKCMDNWFKYESLAVRRPIRNYVSSLYDAPSSGQIAALETAFDALGSAYYTLNSCFLLKNVSANGFNQLIDLCRLGYVATMGTVTWTANTSMATPGANNNGLVVSWNPSINAFAGLTDSNVCFGFYLLSNVSGGGTARSAFGRSSGGTMAIRQTTTNVEFFVNDGTSTIGTESALTGGQVYVGARNGGTKELYRNGTLDASGSVAVTSVLASNPIVGYFNSPALPFAGTFACVFSGVYSDRLTYSAALKSLCDSW